MDQRTIALASMVVLFYILRMTKFELRKLLHYFLLFDAVE